jgi:dynein heavy chain 1
LECERPEIEKQRNDILKLQGEQNVKLRGLEEQMLREISTVKGSILDDDRVVAGMERLMTEGAQVEEQIAKSAEVMAEVERSIGTFEPLSLICKQLFVLLAGMRELDFLYEFTAQSFMSILWTVLKSNTISSSDGGERLPVLKAMLFQEVASRVGRGLKAEDKMVFALLLARIATGQTIIDERHEASSTDEITFLIDQAFGADFPWQGKGLNNLKDVTFKDITSTVPCLVCSAPGHDVSGRVEAMAKSESKELLSIAMGSAEGYKTAETFIATASKRGTWVMLKNCHLCAEWLGDSLVKILQSLNAVAHHDFRIFITSEISPKLPTALLQMSDVIVAESPTGIKASLSRFFSSVSSERFRDNVRNRLYLILGWVHGVIQERLRFMPTGWSEQYEFTEADAIHALDVIDSLVDEACGKKQNLDPEKLPWEAIRATLCKGVFGGRITNDSDQEILDNLVNQVFVPEAFDVDFSLATAEGAPALPEGSSKDELFAWIDSLPSHNPPTWIGLDVSAEIERDKIVAENVVRKCGIVTRALSDD